MLFGVLKFRPWEKPKVEIYCFHTSCPLLTKIPFGAFSEFGAFPDFVFRQNRPETSGAVGQLSAPFPAVAAQYCENGGLCFGEDQLFCCASYPELWEWHPAFPLWWRSVRPGERLRRLRLWEVWQLICWELHCVISHLPNWKMNAVQVKHPLL